jgi:hypothetical protein
MFLRELFVNPKRLLLEGGNIWPESEEFDQAIAQHLVNETNRYLKGIKTSAHVIGSAATPTPGKMSGDLDVMVDVTHLMKHFGTKDGKTTRVELEKYLQGQGLQTRKTGVTVHILLPYKGKFYQVDIKTVANAERVRKFHHHTIPQGSPYKGVHKQMMMNALASSQGLLWSPDEGLYTRDDMGKKAGFISDDLDVIAKHLLGKHAKGTDLGSVESILAAIPDEARRNDIFQKASSGASWQAVSPTPVNEETKPTVGRKYQHIEDLVFTNGSNGGLHAVERLRHMGSADQGGIEIKWDGSPVIYWGRDERGQFHMIPKNAWDYLKRGVPTTKSGASTMMNGPDDITKFVLGTGDAEKHDKQRVAFAHGLGKLWNYFESVSPESGYIEGGILFSPIQPAKLNKASGDYEFQPNITKFHIPSNSDLGQRISQAKIMVAATGYYDKLGGGEGRYPNAENLSTPDVIVQGTTYVEQAPGVDEAGLKKVTAYITKHAANIDSFVAGQPGLSKPGDILYKFFNQNLRVAGVKTKFAEWVHANISAGQAQKVLAHPGLDAVLTAVEMISNEKMKLIGKLSQGTHGGIRQTKPEGYVQAHPGTGFANDLPGQFVKTIDQANWAPRKD